MTEQAAHLPAAPHTTMQDQALARWNWGAFVFGWIWALAMRLWIVALPLLLINIACYLAITTQFWAGAATEQVPQVLAHAEHAGHGHGESAAASSVMVMSTLVMQVVWAAVIINVVVGVLLGWMGNRLAWKSRKWDSLLQFRVTQLAWEKYGRPIGITVLTLVPMYFILSKFAS